MKERVRGARGCSAPSLLTSTEVMARFNIKSKTTLRARIRTGDVPAPDLRSIRPYLWSQVAIEAALARRRAEGDRRAS